jgi:hypothetical protein
MSVLSVGGGLAASVALLAVDFTTVAMPAAAASVPPAISKTSEVLSLPGVGG